MNQAWELEKKNGKTLQMYYVEKEMINNTTYFDIYENIGMYNPEMAPRY